MGFTQNQNGVFFDISLLDDEVANEIELFVDFCIFNKVELDEYDKQINECKLNNCFDKMKTSIPLSKVIVSDMIVDDWQGLIAETKTNDRINAFVHLLENNTDKVVAKRGNTKFMNAKKKYSRKQMTDKKNEGDLQNTLDIESYEPYEVNESLEVNSITV